MKNDKIVEWNILRSKELVHEALNKDKIIIFFTRIAEDLKRYQNPNFYGRLKELYLLIYPYSNIQDPKILYKDMKKSDFDSKDGLILDDEERGFVKKFIDFLDDEQCKIKNKRAAVEEIEEIQAKLVRKYLPNSSKLVEAYILGKLIASVGGIDRISKMPSSTIQIIGAEKALFRYMSKHTSCPKYGLIYDSVRIGIKKGVKPREAGKRARQLANKLSLNLRVDYFRNFSKSQ